MEWHIITSSKGGVGKTLLALLLAARHLERGQTPLVIDLNAMNADSSALLVEGVSPVEDSEYKPEITLDHQKAAGETEQLGAENIIIQRTNSFSKEGPIPYAVGWPSNPYNLYKPSLFADFLCTIKSNLGRIKEELGLNIQTIIIDTNYHFCNIFSSQGDQYYEGYHGKELENDKITCWFLWVYRQFNNLLEKKVGSDKVYQSARLMEKHLKRGDDHACIMHVITPVSLISSQIVQEQGTSGKKWPILSLLFTFEQEEERNKRLIVEGLDKTEKLSISRYKNFTGWVRALVDAEAVLQVYGNEERKDDDQDRDALEGGVFLEILLRALKDERPMNVIPLWDYHPTLQRYTDKYAKDPLATLMKHKIYENLNKLLNTQSKS